MTKWVLYTFLSILLLALVFGALYLILQRDAEWLTYDHDHKVGLHHAHKLEHALKTGVKIPTIDDETLHRLDKEGKILAAKIAHHPSRKENYTKLDKDAFSDADFGGDSEEDAVEEGKIVGRPTLYTNLRNWYPGFSLNNWSWYLRPGIYITDAGYTSWFNKKSNGSYYLISNGTN